MINKYLRTITLKDCKDLKRYRKVPRFYQIKANEELVNIIDKEIYYGLAIIRQTI